MSRTKKPKATKNPAAKKISEKKRPLTVPRKSDGTIDWRRYDEALKELKTPEIARRWLPNYLPVPSLLPQELLTISGARAGLLLGAKIH